MFMAAGLIYAALGHDRIAGLAGIGRVLPVSVLTFALGGLALMGVPASGAYAAKELLVRAASETGQWWWALVLDGGGFFTGAYLFLVLVHALTPAGEALSPRTRVPLARELAALTLALCSLVLGLVHWGGLLPVPSGIPSSPLGFDAVWKSVLTFAGGAVVAVLLGRWGDRLPQLRGRDAADRLIALPRRVGLALGGAVEQADGVLRDWPVAGVALLFLVLLFGAAMLAAGGS
jgi:NADH:ubiquinone oxidoreductase subunit 5 (subunit L)/multisubunit Na+/H+ antiporter MnhA subunit